MYDVSGVPADRIEKVIKVDWEHLMQDKRVLESPYYLREGGKPVIALWGFGFAGRGHSPDVVRAIVRHLRAATPGGAYIMAGAPTHWQTLRGDADPNPEFLHVWYNEFDAVSPWTVGRYHNEETVDRFAKEKVQKDIEALKNNTGGRKVDYIPVVFPGGSGFNLSQGKWGLNEMARDGGRFLWRQVYNVRKAGVRIIYGAMWDEYDEGTAFLPVVSKKRELPKPGAFLALDADGYDLPPDWYMRICGFAGEILRGERQVHETFPVKDLQDYWSSRPKYEPLPTQLEPTSSSSQAGASGSADGIAQSYAEWCEQEKEGKDDLPPPPYSIEEVSTAAREFAGADELSASIHQATSHQRPPVPTQTRPASLPANSSYAESQRPGSRASASGSSQPSSSAGLNWNHAQSPPPPVPLGNRPTSLPTSLPPGSAPQQGWPQQQGALQATKPSGPSPGEIFHHPRPPPQQPPWGSRPQQQQYNDPEGQGQLSLSVASLNNQFGRQSLNDAPSHDGPAPHSMHNPYSPEAPVNYAEKYGQYTSPDARMHGPPPRPPTTPQWPPPEWGPQPQCARPATLPPSPSQRPPTRPPSNPYPGYYGPSPFPPPNSASQAAPPLPSPAWDKRPGSYPISGPDPEQPSSAHAPYAQYVAPPLRRQYSSSEYPSPTSTYPSTYPGAGQYPSLPTPNGYDYGPESVEPGGFYMGPPHRPYGAPSPGPGSIMPPPVHPRPGQIMPSSSTGPSPGGLIPGRLGGVASGTYAYTAGAVGKVAGPDTRRRFEDGIGSLSTGSVSKES
ncbi:hypothetical protein EW145_g7486 [Phellinidium pouzarii]|uniref:Uncharacterized protein n=1 Tax=Phellinidium pouzarii TaxID=167371 RepID=A0A4S4KJM1_9AGAM|nr:hypothetical protein EW145_g7486 [Phellinidium pouzarii]